MRVNLPTSRTEALKLPWSNGYDVRLTRERFRVRSSVLVFTYSDYPHRNHMNLAEPGFDPGTFGL